MYQPFDKRLSESINEALEDDRLKKAEHTHGGPPSHVDFPNREAYQKAHDDWAAKDRAWRDADKASVMGHKRFSQFFQAATQVCSKFKQKLEADEAYHDDDGFSLTASLSGLNTMGNMVDCLASIHFFYSYEDRTLTEFNASSYWTDGEATMDGVELLADHETVQEEIHRVCEFYNLEKPTGLPDFGNDWLNNLALICWLMPQIQNEVGADAATLQRLQVMRSNAIKQTNEYAAYKMLIPHPDRPDEEQPTLTYYGVGRPSDLMEQFGQNTIFIVKMSDADPEDQEDSFS